MEMKPDLIILHGALGCKEQFTAWKNILSEKFNCYVFDFSGHGTKAGDENDYSIELFSEELEAVIKKNNLIKPHILGYSMGGYVALNCAKHNGGLIGKIITVATKFDWNLESAKKEAGYLQPNIMEAKVPKLAAQLKERHGTHWEKVVERTAAMMLKLGERPLITHANIGKISNNIKFCVGENDKMVSDKETLEMCRHAANGNYSCLGGSAHLPESFPLQLIKDEVEGYLLT